jgi:hypothetical protein
VGLERERMQPGRHHLAGSLALAGLVLVCGLAAVPPAAPPAAPARLRLAVLLVFDQMRPDYLERWRDLFGPGGFRRLLDEGAVFADCHYPYSDTYTAPGHASVATGTSPDRHGVVGNDWYDREAREVVSCVGSARYPAVPPRPPSKKAVGVSPERLLAPTLADALKEATAGQARVVSLSLKDRAAVLPGGRRPDACYWFNGTAGRFETSTYYRDAVHPWVAAFNRGPTLGRWFGQQWTRLRPDLDYEAHSGPDDVPGEGDSVLKLRTFPHPLGGIPLPASLYYQAVGMSPFGNDILLELTRTAVAAEDLGRHSVPDLLCVSFSSNDSVGHAWGPDSQEVLDVTLRTDRLLADLLAFLDAQVGKGRYTLVLTADHGVCPLPELSRRRGLDAGRVPRELLTRRADDFLRTTFATGTPSAVSPTRQRGSHASQWVEAVAEEWVYLDRDTIARHGLRQADVEDTLAAWLERQPGVQAAYTRGRLLAGQYGGDRVAGLVRRSFYPARSGDVAIVNRPYWVMWAAPGTTHGTPHPYDTHVPLVVLGPGVRPGVREGRVTPQAAATILAHALGVRPPAAAEAPLPEDLFGPGR